MHQQTRTGLEVEKEKRAERLQLEEERKNMKRGDVVTDVEKGAGVAVTGPGAEVGALRAALVNTALRITLARLYRCLVPMFMRVF
jgi:hypothetical protein